MQAFLALALKELRIVARDAHGLAVLFVMPAVFILIMSLALRDALSPQRSGALDVLWLDQDGGYFALALADTVKARTALRRRAVADEAALRQALEDGALFAVQVEQGLDQRIATEGAQRPALVRVFIAPSAPPASRMLFLSQLRGALAQVQSEWLLEDLMGVPHEDAEAMRARSDPAALPVDEVAVGAATAVPNAVQQSVPAWLVFAMFFVVLPLSVSVLAEREQGNLRRLALLNLGPARLLAAKLPAYYLVNLVQFVLMLAVGVWLVPALGGERLALGDSAVGLWLVASALSVAAIGFALLVAVLARTSVQAITFGGIANLLLGAIGGVMVPKSVMPPAMQAASHASPMSWALEGLWDILLRGGGAVQVLPECAVLISFGAGCLILATLLFPDPE